MPGFPLNLKPTEADSLGGQGQRGLAPSLQREGQTADVPKIIMSFHSEISLLVIYPKKEKAVSTKVTRGLFIQRRTLEDLSGRRSCFVTGLPLLDSLAAFKSHPREDRRHPRVCLGQPVSLQQALNLCRDHS